MLLFCFFDNLRVSCVKYDVECELYVSRLVLNQHTEHNAPTEKRHTARSRIFNIKLMFARNSQRLTAAAQCLIEMEFQGHQ